MATELDERVEQVVRAAGRLYVAVYDIDAYLQEADCFHAMPEELREQLNDALKRCGAAYGQLRAAQYAPTMKGAT